jgi:hypothetical protein
MEETEKMITAFFSWEGAGNRGSEVRLCPWSHLSSQSGLFGPDFILMDAVVVCSFLMFKIPELETV